MPAKSKKQRRFMGMLYNCKETGDCPSEEIKEKAKKIKKKDVREYAKTKHKGLPEKVKRKKRRKRKKRGGKKSHEVMRSLIRLANHLDASGCIKEADYLDNIIDNNINIFT